MKSVKIMVALLLFSGMILLNSCDKKAGESMYKVRMTDAPAAYSQVNIDLRSVQVIGSNGTATLNTNAGIYNILQFNNGLDTLIAYGAASVGTIQQVRLTLGNNNTVVSTGGQVSAMTMPADLQGGVTVNVQQSADNTLLIDFDASQSVSASANGSFELKPVLRPIAVSATGSATTSAAGTISGYTLALGAGTVVSATGSSGTFTSVIAANGQFKILGLSAGTYSLTLTPSLATLHPITISGVTVTAGSTTDLGLIALQ